MGTAPNDRQYPAMPDPDRVVRSSLGFLRRLGLSDQTALDVIGVVARRTANRSSELSPDFLDWLADLQQCVIRRRVSLRNTGTAREGNDNANR
jgi:hypothetical protein